MASIVKSPLLLLLLTVSVLSSSFAVHAKPKGRLFDDPLLQRVVSIVSSQYWKGPIDDDSLLRASIEGIVEHLNEEDAPEDRDRADGGFNRFLASDDYRLLKQDLKGGFFGIGAVIRRVDGREGILVEELLSSSPAKKAGLKAGDLILELDGRDLRSFRLREAVKVLRGPAGSEVELLVERDGVELRFSFSRGPVELPCVQERMLQGSVGYLRIRQFDKNCNGKTRLAINKLLRQGARSLILDLRANPGGRLDGACRVSDAFLPKGAPIVGVKRYGQKRVLRRSQKQALWTGPIVCLVDSKTASGAEILAGALRERDRGILLGEKTFGKDTVQTVFKLPRGQALKISTMKLFLRGPLDGGKLIPDVFLAPQGQFEGARSHRKLEEIPSDPWVKSSLALLRFEEKPRW